MRKRAYKYNWTRRFGVSAQVFGEVYYSLKHRSPEELVEAARKRRSPLHKLFEWDDRRAAQEHRLLQARVMINSLQVEIITPKGKPGNVIAFIRGSKLGRYVATLEATGEELTAAMQECWRDMSAFRRRYRNLEIAADVIRAIGAVELRLSRMKRKAA